MRLSIEVCLQRCQNTLAGKACRAGLDGNSHLTFLFRFGQAWMVYCCLSTSLPPVSSVCSAGAPLPGQGAARRKRWCTVAESGALVADVGWLSVLTSSLSPRIVSARRPPGVSRDLVSAQLGACRKLAWSSCSRWVCALHPGHLTWSWLLSCCLSSRGQTEVVLSG